MTPNLQYAPARSYEEVHHLEEVGYPLEEAASLETLRYRGKVAPELFLCAYLPAAKTKSNVDDKVGTAEADDKLVGYVVATLADGDKLTHESMSQHVPSGRLVCIHSVCVGSQYRRRGIATDMVNEYISRLRRQNDAARKSHREVPFRAVSLLCHRPLLSLYVDRCGFRCVGESDVVHGPERWYDCRMDLE